MRTLSATGCLDVPALPLIACAIMLVAGSLVADATADTPPAVPDPDARARFVAAKQEAAEAYLAATELPRAIHDEYDVDHYDVSLDLDIPTHVLTGRVEAQITAQVADLSRIDLDLLANMTSTSTTVNGTPAFGIHNGDILTVILDQTYQPGETFTVAVTYHGTPSAAGAPFRWNTHNGVPMVLSYSEPYGAPAWWVCKDDPKDKATFAIHITAPDTLVAVSNGLLDSEVNNGNGTKTFTWIHDYPMSPYLFSIAVTNFQSWTEVYTGLDGVSTMDVDYYAYPEDFSDAQISWGRNVEMMEYYASIFGEYPFLDEKYAIAEFHHPGAMEHQTATSMGWGWVVPSTSNDWVVAHELAHSWVGDMITMREWSHAWTKEGFATYCEALYFEDKYGTPYYHTYMAGMNIMAYAATQLYNITPPLASAIYYKGAWVLHMLRHVVGDQNFFDAIYAYTNDPGFRYGVSDTNDLRDVFEAVSGMDLDWFFDQWIYGPGYPIYDWGWDATWTGTGYDIELRIDQVQTLGPVFKMPIDIRVRGVEANHEFVVWDSLQTQTFALHIEDGGLSGIDLDREDWIINGVVVAGIDPATVGGGVSMAQNRPNPFGPSATTEIAYRIDRSGPTRIEVFDTTGRRVRSLLDAVLPEGPGLVSWDGTDASGRPAAAGVYYYRIRSGEQRLTRRLVVVR